MFKISNSYVKEQLFWVGVTKFSINPDCSFQHKPYNKLENYNTMRHMLFKMLDFFLL